MRWLKAAVILSVLQTEISILLYPGPAKKDLLNQSLSKELEELIHRRCRGKECGRWRTAF